LLLHWIAEYADGTCLKDHGQPASYRDLDRAKLVMLGLADENDKPIVTVKAKQGCILFYRIYNSIWGTEIKDRFYVVGLRKSDGSVEFTVVIPNDIHPVIQIGTSFTDPERPEIFEPTWFPEEQ